MRGERGQAAAELVALVPALLLLALAGWQIVVAAHAWQLARGAADRGARAAVVEAPADSAVRASLGPGWARGLHVATTAHRPGAWVRVSLPVPPVLPGLPPLGRVSGTAQAAP